MLQQLFVILALYVIGVLFAALFYPKLSLNLIVSSGLFWGELINTLLGIVLGLFGCYKDGIWIALGISSIILVCLNLRRSSIWKNENLISVVKPFSLMLVLFILGYLFFGNGYKTLTSSTSFPYFIHGSHVSNYGTLIIKGAGFDFRSHYGISEILISALANSVDLPIMTLWHPFLWISQYAFLFFVIIEFSKKVESDKNYAVVVGLATAIWIATSPMNWLLSFYIHVHLFSSFAMMICVFFYWLISRTSTNESEYALLSSLALCGYGLSRVESPIFILIILAIFFISSEFNKQEYRALFYPPLALNIIWLTFLLKAYPGTVTQYWTDRRLMIALGTYILGFLSLIMINVFRFSVKISLIRRIFNYAILSAAIVLCASDPNRLFQTIRSVFRNMFGTINNPGFGSWGFYWIEVFLLFFFILMKLRTKKRKKDGKISFSHFLNIIFAYFFLIIVLGFYRQNPYTGIRWGDSASRMLTHISPLVGLTIGLFLTNELKLNRKSKDQD